MADDTPHGWEAVGTMLVAGATWALAHLRFRRRKPDPPKLDSEWVERFMHNHADRAAEREATAMTDELNRRLAVVEVDLKRHISIVEPLIPRYLATEAQTAAIVREMGGLKDEVHSGTRKLDDVMGAVNRIAGHLGVQGT